MKHNNVIPNAHFHKDWVRYLKLWFNQPANKLRRRNVRVEKAKRIAPRPLELLRPIVRGQTNKYNSKVRAGRGFTLDEIKAAGIRKKEALGIGIPVDHRRKNRCDEGFQQNVNRLKQYKTKLVVFPRNATSQRAKKGDASKEALKQVQQNTTKNVLPIHVDLPRIKPRKITEEERNQNVYSILHKARMDEKLKGAREKRAKDKKEGKNKDKNKKKVEEEPMDE